MAEPSIPNNTNHPSNNSSSLICIQENGLGDTEVVIQDGEAAAPLGMNDTKEEGLSYVVDPTNAPKLTNNAVSHDHDGLVESQESQVVEVVLTSSDETPDMGDDEPDTDDSSSAGGDSPLLPVPYRVSPIKGSCNSPLLLSTSPLSKNNHKKSYDDLMGRSFETTDTEDESEPDSDSTAASSAPSPLGPCRKRPPEPTRRVHWADQQQVVVVPSSSSPQTPSPPAALQTVHVFQDNIEEATIRIVFLLMQEQHPTSNKKDRKKKKSSSKNNNQCDYKFEFVHAEVSTEDRLLVSDILEQIPGMATLKCFGGGGSPNNHNKSRNGSNAKGSTVAFATLPPSRRFVALIREADPYEEFLNICPLQECQVRNGEILVAVQAGSKPRTCLEKAHKLLAANKKMIRKAVRRARIRGRALHTLQCSAEWAATKQLAQQQAEALAQQQAEAQAGAAAVTKQEQQPTVTTGDKGESSSTQHAASNENRDDVPVKTTKPESDIADPENRPNGADSNNKSNRRPANKKSNGNSSKGRSSSSKSSTNNGGSSSSSRSSSQPDDGFLCKKVLRDHHDSAAEKKRRKKPSSSSNNEAAATDRAKKRASSSSNNNSKKKSSSSSSKKKSSSSKKKSKKSSTKKEGGDAESTPATTTTEETTTTTAASTTTTIPALDIAWDDVVNHYNEHHAIGGGATAAAAIPLPPSPTAATEAVEAGPFATYSRVADANDEVSSPVLNSSIVDGSSPQQPIIHQDHADDEEEAVDVRYNDEIILSSGSSDEEVDEDDEEEQTVETVESQDDGHPISEESHPCGDDKLPTMVASLCNGNQVLQVVAPASGYEPLLTSSELRNEQDMARNEDDDNIAVVPSSLHQTTDDDDDETTTTATAPETMCSDECDNVDNREKVDEALHLGVAENECNNDSCRTSTCEGGKPSVDTESIVTDAEEGNDEEEDDEDVNLGSWEAVLSGHNDDLDEYEKVHNDNVGAAAAAAAAAAMCGGDPNSSTEVCVDEESAQEDDDDDENDLQRPKFMHRSSSELYDENGSKYQHNPSTNNKDEPQPLCIPKQCGEQNEETSQIDNKSREYNEEDMVNCYVGVPSLPSTPAESVIPHVGGDWGEPTNDLPVARILDFFDGAVESGAEASLKAEEVVAENNDNNNESEERSGGDDATGEEIKSSRETGPMNNDVTLVENVLEATDTEHCFESEEEEDVHLGSWAAVLAGHEPDMEGCDEASVEDDGARNDSFLSFSESATALDFEDELEDDKLRIVVLLFHAEKDEYEFLHCEFSTDERLLVKDVLRQLPVLASTPTFFNPECCFGSLVRDEPPHDELLNILTLQDYPLRNGEVLIAIHEGVFPRQCIKRAQSLVRSNQDKIREPGENQTIQHLLSSAEWAAEKVVGDSSSPDLSPEKTLIWI